jgi:hypothetical protein
MRNFELKIVGSSIKLIDVENPNVRQKSFKDLLELVFHANEHNIKIINKDILSENIQKMLKNQ